MPQNTPLSWTSPADRCCRLQTWGRQDQPFSTLLQH